MKEAFDCQTNSPFQYLRKCIKSSMENMLTDVRVLRVNEYITYVSVRLYGNRSQMTLKCGKNKKKWINEVQATVSLMFLPYFDVIVTAAGSLCVLYIKKGKILLTLGLPVSDQDRISPNYIYTISCR